MRCTIEFAKKTQTAHFTLFCQCNYNDSADMPAKLYCFPAISAKAIYL